jgi:hypothetical protein
MLVWTSLVRRVPLQMAVAQPFQLVSDSSNEVLVVKSCHYVHRMRFSWLNHVIFSLFFPKKVVSILLFFFCFFIFFPLRSSLRFYFMSFALVSHSGFSLSFRRGFYREGIYPLIVKVIKYLLYVGCISLYFGLMLF